MDWKKYLLNFLISLDQLGNTILGGDPDETISSRLGRIKLDHGGKIPWDHPLARVTDSLLDDIDKNHSIDAIEPAGYHGETIPHQKEVIPVAETMEKHEKGQ